MRQTTRSGLDGLGVLAVFAFALGAAAKATRLQWDFRVYLEAARAARAGLDPYVLESLAKVSGRPAHLPFLYPPAALAPFLGLSLLAQPFVFWIALKVALLVFLVVLWKRVFLPGDVPWTAVALAAVFSSNAAALWDLRSGNVGLVEAALVWGALALRVRGRDGWFATLIVLAATFKLLPAAFLVLLLFDRRWRTFAVAALALAAITLVPEWLLGWRGFLGASHADLPRGEANPSLASFLLEHAPKIAWPAWAAASLALVALAARRVRKSDRCGQSIAAVMLFLLVSPRPMAYGWVLGGGALVACAWRAVPSGLARAALLAAIVLQGALFASGNPLSGPATGILPWVVALLVGLLAAFASNAGKLQKPPSTAQPGMVQSR